MTKIKQRILLFFLFSFSLYCALTIGQSWDEASHLDQGKITLDYLFSLGRIDNDIIYRENYSSIYWSFQYIFTKIFPGEYKIQASHLVNLVFSLATIFGIAKISKILFDKKIGNIVFLILFFFPIFFGHMGFNNKDTILAFGHVWITYYAIEYLRKQNVVSKINKKIIYIGILAAVSTGIQLVFLGSLIPIFLFIMVEIFYAKKIICNNFKIKKFIFDLFKTFIIFYIFLIFFWIDAHPNILALPYNFFMGTFSSTFLTGWPYNLVNGDYFISSEVPKFYFLINFIYKAPEYILFSYLLFIFLYIKKSIFFKKRFKFFNYKIAIFFIILIYPDLISLIIPYPLYDGLRLFLWSIPYFCIIPALTIYYLIENFKFKSIKILTSILTFLIFIFLYSFFSITPYQYTYLNSLNGEIDKRYQKFEGDYWASSLKELFKKSSFEKNNTLNFSTCGADNGIAKKYLQKNGYYNIDFVPPKNAEYMVMTNRVVSEDNNKNKTPKLTNCFDKYSGKDIFKVERNGLPLSIIRQIKLEK
tara:strand:- start:5323 stop:6912 length:1590 start_codon:yes stop_codon:yes gene_type:complete